MCPQYLDYLDGGHRYDAERSSGCDASPVYLCTCVLLGGSAMALGRENTHSEGASGLLPPLQHPVLIVGPDLAMLLSYKPASPSVIPSP